MTDSASINKKHIEAVNELVIFAKKQLDYFMSKVKLLG